MAGDKSRESMDDAMNDIRERLRHVSENLRKAREAATLPEKKERPASFRTENPNPVSSQPRLTMAMWHDHLLKLSHRLESVTRDTEADFLSIGSHLHDFYSRAHKISEMSERVAGLVTDKELESSIVELNNILSRMKSWIESTGGGASNVSNARIKAGMVVDKTSVCLDTLQRKHYKSAYMLMNFSARSDELVRSIGKIVESLQYNDITRQQIEHASSAILALMEQLRESGIDNAVSDLPSCKKMAAEAGRVCSVQASILMLAKDDINSALKSVIDNLRVISKNASEVSDEIRMITKGDCENGKSFLSGMGTWLSALSDTLTEYSESACHDELSRDGQCADFLKLSGELVGIVGSLRKINGDILYSLTLIDEAGADLSGQIEKVVDGIVVHERISRTAEDVAEGLTRIVDGARHIAPEECSFSAQPGFGMKGADEGRYGTCKRQEKNAGNDDGLGDNIEMF